jgi:hypothetical protein
MAVVPSLVGLFTVTSSFVRVSVVLLIVLAMVIAIPMAVVFAVVAAFCSVVMRVAAVGMAVVIVVALEVDNQRSVRCLFWENASSVRVARATSSVISMIVSMGAVRVLGFSC